jgi:putative membrane protein
VSPSQTRAVASARLPVVLGLLAAVAVPVSFAGTADRFTWLLESLPVIVGLPVIVLLWRRYRLSNLLCVLLFIHALVLLLGGHYTYAQVPLGEWARGWFGWQRNNYDKVGHFLQGFEPAILTREILLRWSPFAQAPRSRLVPMLCVAAPLAFSALYEIIEWQVALATGAGADAFLGTQGDPWDTQSDMAFALLGALCAVLLLRRWHDRSMAAAAGA